MLLLEYTTGKFNDAIFRLLFGCKLLLTSNLVFYLLSLSLPPSLFSAPLLCPRACSLSRLLSLSCPQVLLGETLSSAAEACAAATAAASTGVPTWVSLTLHDDLSDCVITL